MLVSVSQETTDYAHLQGVMDQGIPLVLFDRATKDIQASSVVVDDFNGAYNGVCHLVARGYERIAHLAGSATLYVGRERRSGYEAALREHGLPVREEYIVTGGYHEEDGRIGMQRLLDLAHPPDAVFALNDPVALGAFVYLQELGIKVGEEMGLVGFSNNPNTTLVRPRLTTINQPAFEIGSTAARLLLKTLTNGSTVHTVEMVTLKTELVIRESS
jgi:LacI family transcriptional regulator